MNKYFIKIVLLLCSLIFLYYKPFYSIVVFCIFAAEYYYFLIFWLNIYNNYDNYYVIMISELDISELKLTDIWFEYCKLLSFQKVYRLFIKNKKINYLSVVFSLSIILLGIPYKILNLIYYFFTSKNNFRNALIDLYFNLYFKLKDLKIEVLNRKIYLNCITIGKLCNNILIKNKLITEDKFVKGIKALQTQTREFAKFELETVEVKLISGKNTDGDIIYAPHYGWKEGNTTAHATSRLPDRLKDNQLSDVAIPQLVLSKAKNPATIITKEIKEIVSINKSKIIRRIDMESIKYNHSELFKEDTTMWAYIATKDKVYEEILIEYFDFNKKIDSIFIKDLRTNNYNITLELATDNEFIDGYNNFYKDHTI